MQTTLLILLILLLILVCWVIVIQFTSEFLRVDGKDVFKKINFLKKKDKDEYNKMMTFIGKLVCSLIKMSNDKVGALIVIEKNDSLNQYINIGNKIESDFFPELVYTIFYNKKSPLHDGAIIVRNWKIVSVSSYLPTSKKIINVQYGARHRAAFGIAEKFDCFAFVVSETNGNITGVHLDEIKKLSDIPEKLTSQIIKMFSASNLISINKNSFEKKEKHNKKNKDKNSTN